MREIKFRGKREKDGRWYYGYYSFNHTFQEHWITYDIDGAKVKDISISVNPETVGQYTGLKDKNGKEIYEGDILKTSFCDGVIDWFWNGWHIRTEDWQYFTLRTAKHSHEVIGNIHETTPKTSLT